MQVSSTDLSVPLHSPVWRPLVVLADDDHEFLRWAAGQLRADGYAVGVGYSGREVLDYMSKAVLMPRRFTTPSLLICDLYMPGLSGLQLADTLHRAHCLPPWALMTAFADEQVRANAARLAALAVMEKPFTAETLRELARKALEKAS
jgi:two-component system, LuxR family, response regulator FixJ